MNIDLKLSGQKFSLSDTVDRELIELLLREEIERKFPTLDSITVQLKRTQSALHGEIFDNNGALLGHAIVSLGKTAKYFKVIPS